MVRHRRDTHKDVRPIYPAQSLYQRMIIIDHQATQSTERQIKQSNYGIVGNRRRVRIGRHG